MATYHGIVKAKCRECGYETEDDTTLELWNDAPLIGACPECDMQVGLVQWWMEDGSQVLTEHDEEHGLVGHWTKTPF